jgi:formylglycine-generating enzyme required for sulfatase activity
VITILMSVHRWLGIAPCLLFRLLVGACIAVAAGAVVHTQAASPAMPDIAWAQIPAGTFQMGCVPADELCNTDEHPRHQVTITKPFDLMTTEVTVAMFRASGLEVDEQPAWSKTPSHPMVIVTWSEAVKFCQMIGGRLPTEAEWEYAARGGHEGGIYPWGDEPPDYTPNTASGAAFESDNPQPVKSFGANGYGLFDMAGNVWEWTADFGTIYRPDAVSDPQGLASGRSRIVRGGSFGDDPRSLRVSNRTPNQPDRVNVNVGFRCARDVRG